jgi:hypothetical protein
MSPAATFGVPAVGTGNGGARPARLGPAPGDPRGRGRW